MGLKGIIGGTKVKRSRCSSKMRNVCNFTAQQRCLSSPELLIRESSGGFAVPVPVVFLTFQLQQQKKNRHLQASLSRVFIWRTKGRKWRFAAAGFTQSCWEKETRKSWSNLQSALSPAVSLLVITPDRC